MRSAADSRLILRPPQLLAKSIELQRYLQTLSVTEIASMMQLSPKLAAATVSKIAAWTDKPILQRAAIDSFLGDVYSGLQVTTLTLADRRYADKHLRILSGLYGILRPLDGIYPYRLEMGYKLATYKHTNLYNFWGSAVADTLAGTSSIINLTAAEYGKIVLPHIAASRLITPKFLTINHKTGKPTFVAVHAKIARGAFAGWVIRRRIQDRIKDSKVLKDFTDLGYKYEPSLSSTAQPVFVCNQFKGIGLSVRLT